MGSPHKTNGIRILESSKIPYKTHEYEAPEGFLDGVAAAHAIGLPEEKVYKTLVTLGHSKGVYVFVIPVAAELDLKKAAKAAKEKKMDMLPAKDITPVTGYIKGGCSPVGMKKNYPTFLEVSCRTLDTMVVSAGRVGLQMELAPADLIAVTRGETASLIKE
jgi:Cys-tRNA(Pro)/Cys-tRNA(Cys) deacylase